MDTGQYLLLESQFSDFIDLFNKIILIICTVLSVLSCLNHIFYFSVFFNRLSLYFIVLQYVLPFFICLNPVYCATIFKILIITLIYCTSVVHFTVILHAVLTCFQLFFFMVLLYFSYLWLLIDSLIDLYFKNNYPVYECTVLFKTNLLMIFVILISWTVFKPSLWLSYAGWLGYCTASTNITR